MTQADDDDVVDFEDDDDCDAGNESVPDDNASFKSAEDENDSVPSESDLIESERQILDVRDEPQLRTQGQGQGQGRRRHLDERKTSSHIEPVMKKRKAAATSWSKPSPPAKRARTELSRHSRGRQQPQRYQNEPSQQQYHHRHQEQYQRRRSRENDVFERWLLDTVRELDSVAAAPIAADTATGDSVVAPKSCRQAGCTLRVVDGRESDIPESAPCDGRHLAFSASDDACDLEIVLDDTHVCWVSDGIVRLFCASIDSFPIIVLAGEDLTLQVADMARWPKKIPRKRLLLSTLATGVSHEAFAVFMMLLHAPFAKACQTHLRDMHRLLELVLICELLSCDHILVAVVEHMVSCLTSPPVISKATRAHDTRERKSLLDRRVSELTAEDDRKRGAAHRDRITDADRAHSHGVAKLVRLVMRTASVSWNHCKKRQPTTATATAAVAAAAATATATSTATTAAATTTSPSSVVLSLDEATDVASASASSAGTAESSALARRRHLHQAIYLVVIYVLGQLLQSPRTVATTSELLWHADSWATIDLPRHVLYFVAHYADDGNPVDDSLSAAASSPAMLLSAIRKMLGFSTRYI